MTRKIFFKTVKVQVPHASNRCWLSCVFEFLMFIALDGVTFRYDLLLRMMGSLRLRSSSLRTRSSSSISTQPCWLTNGMRFRIFCSTGTSSSYVNCVLTVLTVLSSPEEDESGALAPTVPALFPLSSLAGSPFLFSTGIPAENKSQIYLRQTIGPKFNTERQLRKGFDCFLGFVAFELSPPNSPSP